MGSRIEVSERTLRGFWRLLTLTETCWLFGSGKGYGNYRGMPAHRCSYTAFIDEIPDGYEVDHLCYVMSCVRPEHLEAVPAYLNRQRALLHHLGVDRPDLTLPHY